MKILANDFDRESNALLCTMKFSAITKHLDLAHGNIRPVCGNRKAADEFELRQVKDLMRRRKTQEQIRLLYDRIAHTPGLKKA